MSKKVNETGIPKSAEDVISGNCPPRRRSFFAGHSEKDISEKITKLAIVQELRIMDEKLDKLTSYLDGLVNHNQESIIGPITRKIAEQAQRTIDQIQQKVLMPEETALAMRVVGSMIKERQEKQTRKTKCQTKKNTNSANQKKICTGSIKARKNNLNVLYKLKSFWGKFFAPT
jgi:hypothetical protein